MGSDFKFTFFLTVSPEYEYGLMLYNQKPSHYESTSSVLHGPEGVVGDMELTWHACFVVISTYALCKQHHSFKLVCRVRKPRTTWLSEMVQAFSKSQGILYSSQLALKATKGSQRASASKEFLSLWSAAATYMVSAHHYYTSSKVAVQIAFSSHCNEVSSLPFDEYQSSIRWITIQFISVL